MRSEVWSNIDLVNAVGGEDEFKGNRVSFVEANEENVIIVLTRHGMRKAIILKFDLNTLKLTHILRREFAFAITKIQVSDAFIFVVPYREKAVIFRRSDLKETSVDVQGIKNFSFVNSTAFNLMKKSGSSPDFILRRLDSPQEKILRYRNVPQANPHPQGICDSKSRLFAIDENALALCCKHGMAQIFDHQKNSLQWKCRPAPYGSDEILHGPYLQKDFVAFVFGFHLQEGAETETSNGLIWQEVWTTSQTFQR